MSLVQACPLPKDALLARYAEAGYADCFSMQVSGSVSQAEFVEAFYTSSLFRVERLLLSWFAGRPSNDPQVKALACGASNTFAAWHVEGRSADQLLLCDFRARTRSWLMVAPSGPEASACTRLYFGSAVVPLRGRSTGSARMGFVFKALLGFHKLYSRRLLEAAGSRLARRAVTAASDRTTVRH